MLIYYLLTYLRTDFIETAVKLKKNCPKQKYSNLFCYFDDFLDTEKTKYGDPDLHVSGKNRLVLFLYWPCYISKML